MDIKCAFVIAGLFDSKIGFSVDNKEIKTSSGKQVLQGKRIYDATRTSTYTF